MQFTASGTGTPLVVGQMAEATTNTTSANAAPTANYDSGAGDFEQLPPVAGADQHIHMTGTLLTGATVGASTQVCVDWAQQASVATNTTVEQYSWMKVTRLN